MKFKQNTQALASFLDEYKIGLVKINKNYQRDYVWVDSKVKSELIRSILNGYPIGTFITAEVDSDDVYQIEEVVDGQQRMTTLLKFWNNEFKINYDVLKKIMNENKKLLIKHSLTDKNTRNILNGEIRTLGFKDLPDPLKRTFEKYQINKISIYESTESEIRDYFASVQNQEKLKAGEIINSIPDSPVTNFFTNDDLNLISNKLNFNNNRMDLLKNLNMITALWNDELRMGAPDKKILSVVSNKMKPNWITTEIENSFKRLKIDANETYEVSYGNTFRVGSLKLFLLTYMFPNIFENYSFSDKRTLIDKSTKLVGFLNSKDINKRNLISEDIFVSIHNIWQLLKTTHTKEQVSKVIEEDLTNVFDYLERNKDA